MRKGPDLFQAIAYAGKQCLKWTGEGSGPDGRSRSTISSLLCDAATRWTFLRRARDWARTATPRACPINRHPAWSRVYARVLTEGVVCRNDLVTLLPVDTRILDGRA